MRDCFDGGSEQHELELKPWIRANMVGDRHGGGADHISGLPDGLLHSILLLLPGTLDAARTSVLSRRWRHVWTRLPELSFIHYDDELPPRAFQRIDAALDAYTVENVHNRLEITLWHKSPRVSADRVTRWLRFASQRFASEFVLTLPYSSVQDEVLVLPLCERLTAICLILNGTVRIRLLSAGVFTALVTLKISFARLDGRELENVVYSRCPRLEELKLERIALQDGATVLSIRSGSLERLEITTIVRFAGRLQVVAPELQILSLSICCDDAYIAAEKLSEVDWHNYYGYDSTRHNLTGTGRHLWRLFIVTNSHATALMRRFDTIDELNLTVYIPTGTQEYQRFLEDINRPASCAALMLRFSMREHACQPTMLHLLRKFAGTRKLVLHYLGCSMEDYACKSPGCPCNFPDGRKTDNIVLDALEEVEVKDQAEADQTVELVKLLCSMTFQKKVAITVSRGSRKEYVREKIRSIYPPNNKVEVTIR